MSYRLDGTDPFLRAAIGAFNGYTMHQSPLSGAALLKRRATGAWHGIWTIDQGSATPYSYAMEFNPSSDHVAADMTTLNPFESAQGFADTTNWMIVGFTWDGTTSAGGWVWRWKIGAGAWGNESETNGGSNANTAGAGYRHVLGNEPGLGDDANFDLCCIGAIESNLSQAAFESLTLADFASWKTVFAGAGAWLLAFDDISTRTDRAGNGGDEVSRSGGITLVADPPGWQWGSPGVDRHDWSQFPKQKLAAAA